MSETTELEHPEAPRTTEFRETEEFPGWISREAKGRDQEINLRAEQVALQIYRKLGVNVPDSKLIESENGVRLLTKEIHNAENIRYFSSELPHLLSEPKIKEAMLAHFFLGNGRIASSLKLRGDEFVWTDAAGAFAMDLGNKFDFSYLNDVPTHLLKEIRDKALVENLNPERFVNVNNPELRPMAEKIAALEAQFVLDELRASGLPLEKRRKLIFWILNNKNNIKVALKPEINSSEKLPAILEKELENNYEQRGHGIYKWHKDLQFIADQLSVYPEAKSKLERLSIDNAATDSPTNDESLSFEEQSDLLQSRMVVVSSSLRELDEQRMEIGRRLPDLHDLLSSLSELQNFQTQLKNIKQQNPAILARIKGRHTRIAVLETKLNSISNQLTIAWDHFEKTIFKVLNDALKYYQESLPSSGIRSDPKLKRFEQPPSQTHLQTLANLKNLLSSDAIANDERAIRLLKPIEETIAEANELREDFQRKCDEIKDAVVSHVTPNDNVLKILASGSLKSPIRLFNEAVERGEKPEITANSGDGSVYLLPQVVFSVNGAEASYGGDFIETSRSDKGDYVRNRKTKSMKSGRPVAFVDSYPNVVKNNLFLESETTGMSIASTELHVFNSDYDNGETKGVSIDISESLLLVPEEKYQEWQERIIQSGKSQEWVAKHLKPYPEDVDLHFYLSEWKHELGLKKQSKGVPISSEKNGVYLQTTNSSSKLFEWETTAD